MRKEKPITTVSRWSHVCQQWWRAPILIQVLYRVCENSLLFPSVSLKMCLEHVACVMFLLHDSRVSHICRTNCILYCTFDTASRVKKKKRVKPETRPTINPSYTLITGTRPFSAIKYFYFDIHFTLLNQPINAGVTDTGSPDGGSCTSQCNTGCGHKPADLLWLWPHWGLAGAYSLLTFITPPPASQPPSLLASYLQSPHLAQHYGTQSFAACKMFTLITDQQIHFCKVRAEHAKSNKNRGM